MKKENIEKESESKNMTVFDENTFNLDKIKYSFPDSKKVIQDIEFLYSLSKNSTKYTSKISSKYLMSTFIMEYIKKLNQLVEQKYSLEHTSYDFNKDNAIFGNFDEISDEPIVSWLDKECLLELDDLIDNIHAFNKESLIRFAHVLHLTKIELEELSVDHDLEIYDLFFRLKDRLNSFDRTKMCTKENRIKSGEFDNDDKVYEITISSGQKSKVTFSGKQSKNSGIVDVSDEYLDYFEYGD